MLTIPTSHKGLHNSYARMGLLLVTVIMFGLSTGHVYIYSRFYIFQFPTLSSDPAGYNPPWLEAEVEKLLRDGMILRRVSVSPCELGSECVDTDTVLVLH